VMPIDTRAILLWVLFFAACSQLTVFDMLDLKHMTVGIVG
jgi:hypothetical protein